MKAIFGKEVEVSENTNRDDRIDGVKTERISVLSSFFSDVGTKGDLFHDRWPGDQDKSPYSVVLVTINNSDSV